MRYLPTKDFPPYSFTPGKHPHPEKPGGHMEHVSVNAVKIEDPKENEAYLYAIDLYNHGFYWESHVWWEALWNCESRRGDKADLLKALIKFAAGKLKEKMGQSEVAQTHFTRAFELLDDLSHHQELLDISIEKLKSSFEKITLEDRTNIF